MGDKGARWKIKWKRGIGTDIKFEWNEEGREQDIKFECRYEVWQYIKFECKRRDGYNILSLNGKWEPSGIISIISL